MKYLLIGGCGFIGCNFAKHLIENNSDVIIGDNLARKGTHLNLKYLLETHRGELQFHHLDIRSDFDKLSNLVEQVDVVFHLAAQVAVTTSIVAPREDFEVNAFGTFNILEAIRKSSSKPLLIYASTNKVYGGMENVQIGNSESRYFYKTKEAGISEETQLDFHSPYGCSKGAGDQYVRDYSRIYGLRTVVFRQSCIYGPHQYGVEDQGWIAWFTIAALLGKTITIYGDGRQVRDVLHVKDLFNLWKLAVDNIDVVSGKVFNVGGGNANTLSLMELLKMLETRMNISIKTNHSGWRSGDQLVYVSDIKRVSDVLKWKPTIGIEQGLDSLVRWVEENKKEIGEFLS